MKIQEMKTSEQEKLWSIQHWVSKGKIQEDSWQVDETNKGRQPGNTSKFDMTTQISVPLEH